MKNRLFLVLSLMLMAATSWSQTINIGGHRAVHDSINDIWLCSIPQSLFGDDFSAVVTYGDDIYDLVIEEHPLESGDSYYFSAIEGGKNYSISLVAGDSLITGNLTFTWLPIVELEGTFDNSYKYGTVTVSEPDSAYAEPLMAKLKWRGGATNTLSKHKRNYRIKFVNEEDSTKQNHRFFGLRKDNNWILDAGQMDFLRVRNRVSTDLWLDMARRPWYSDTLPNVHNGSRGKMVEVILNGEYAGIYNMCEPIDRKQLKLKRYDEENETFNGALWTAYTWTRTVTMSKPAKRGTNSRFWDGFEAKYPDLDETRKVTWDVLDNAVKFAGRADKDTLLYIDSIGEYFDMPVMQDYYIFIVTLQALDNESKNIYYGCHDMNDNHRLTMVPWDLDICLGQDYSPQVSRPDIIKPERQVDWISHVPMADMVQIEEYWNQILERYRELRETKLNTDSLVNRYRAAIDELENSGAAAREENRWSRDQDLAKKVLDLSQEMDYVEDWLRRRMAYLDENVFIKRINYGMKGDVNNDKEINIADVNALIDIILGAAYDEGTFFRADINSDNELNIIDLNGIIDLILN
ncbi:MAG: CotH kinase family protein [Muribaculaceae bacterium]|nr:CotH kinase family protein [Muribaculaceae bacterium]